MTTRDVAIQCAECGEDLPRDAAWCPGCGALADAPPAEAPSDGTPRVAPGEPLPESLDEAIDSFAGSTLMRAALGDHVWETLVSNKRLEWLDYRRQVTQYEIDRYLGL